MSFFKPQQNQIIPRDERGGINAAEATAAAAGRRDYNHWFASDVQSLRNKTKATTPTNTQRIVKLAHAMEVITTIQAWRFPGAPSRHRRISHKTSTLAEDKQYGSQVADVHGHPNYQSINQSWL